MRQGYLGLDRYIARRARLRQQRRDERISVLMSKYNLSRQEAEKLEETLEFLGGNGEHGKITP